MSFIDYSNTIPSFELEILKLWEKAFLEYAKASLSVNKMYELEETDAKVIQFENGRIRVSSSDHVFAIIISTEDDQFLFRCGMSYCNLFNFPKIIKQLEKEKWNNT
jgi:hypothetical protein